MEEWKDKRHVAAHFGVSLSTVGRWIKAGCPALRLGRSSAAPLRFRISEVEQWLNARSQRGFQGPRGLLPG